MIDQLTIEKVIDGVLASEGGFVNDPLDKGGATNYGITLNVLREYKPVFKNASAEDLKQLSPLVARAVYRDKYSAPFEWLSDDTVYAFMVNAAVQHGVTGASKLLQRAVGVKDDGVVGSATKRVVAQLPSTKLLARLVAERCVFYTSIVSRNPTQMKFLKGWVNRIAKDLG